ncbi:MAG: hypothetical protein ACRESZ_21220 [Methylococcales bacterium]
MKDLTSIVREHVASAKCAVISKSTIYLTDRPENRGRNGFKDNNGNSDVEAGHAVDLLSVALPIASSAGRVYASLNNIRIFGPISNQNFLHYHGYSNEELRNKIGAFHCILLTVHAVARYNRETGEVSLSNRIENVEVGGKAGLVLLHEEERVLRIEPLRVGDMVILPSGTYHSFSAAPGVFASYGAIELCDDPKFMYQVHYEEGHRDFRLFIANTIEEITGSRPDDISRLTLADIPGLEHYVETRSKT